MRTLILIVIVLHLLVAAAIAGPVVKDVSPAIAEIGDTITLTIDNLPELVCRAQNSEQKRRIILYLNEMPLSGVVPDPPTDPASKQLKFQLVRSLKTTDVWAHVLKKPQQFEREVRVSVGLENEWAIPSEARPLKLAIAPRGWTLFYTLVLGAVGVALLVLAGKSDVLRDPAPVGTHKPFSLARTQMAWWFFLILGTYLFIGLVTHDFTVGITGSALVLVGISGATFVGAAVIDASQPSTPVPERPWWMELISEHDGVSLHRFQMVVWTLVLGIIFVNYVYNYLAMPQFDEYLLALMGVSAGTYLGAKVPGSSAAGAGATGRGTGGSS